MANYYPNVFSPKSRPARFLQQAPYFTRDYKIVSRGNVGSPLPQDVDPNQIFNADPYSVAPGHWLTGDLPWNPSTAAQGFGSGDLASGGVIPDTNAPDPAQWAYPGQQQGPQVPDPNAPMIIGYFTPEQYWSQIGGSPPGQQVVPGQPEFQPWSSPPVMEPPPPSLPPAELPIPSELPPMVGPEVPSFIPSSILETTPWLSGLMPWLSLPGIGWLWWEILKAMFTPEPGPSGGWVINWQCSEGPSHGGTYPWIVSYGNNPPPPPSSLACLDYQGDLPQVEVPASAVWYVDTERWLQVPVPETYRLKYITNYIRASAVQQPLEVGKTYPLGDPGVRPGHYPSYFPLTAPFVVPDPAPIVEAPPYTTIPGFDHAALQEWSPYIQREVGPGPGPDPDQHVYPAEWVRPDVGFQPAPGTVYDPETGTWVSPVTNPFLPPQLGVNVQPVYGLDSSDFPTNWTDVYIQPANQGGFLTPDPVIQDTPPDIPYSRGGRGRLVRPRRPYIEPPGRTVRKEVKMKATQHWLRLLLAAATYQGALVRNLWKSLPKDCRKAFSRSKKARALYTPGSRPYSRMLQDIYRCLDQIDTQKFGALSAETLLKYGAEGKALSIINTSGVGAGYGLGGATQLYHALGPSGTSGAWQPSSSGGAFSGGKDPFGILGEAIGYINKQAGV